MIYEENSEPSAKAIIKYERKINEKSLVLMMLIHYHLEKNNY